MPESERRAGLVDVHAHFVTPTYVEAAKAAGIEQPDGFPWWPEWSPELHTALMDAHGIAKTILSISTPGVGFGGRDEAARLSRHVNEYAADLMRSHPERFGFFASLPLPDMDAAMSELGLALDAGAEGVVLLSHYDGVYLGDPRFAPMWEELDARGAAVLLHPTSPPGWEALACGRPRPMFEFSAETGRTVTDMVFNEVFLRYPAIRFVVPHCGSGITLLVDRIERFRSLMPAPDGGPASPRSFREQLAGVWFDLAGNPFPDQVPALTRVVPESQLLYGSDYCFTPEFAVVEQLASLDQADPPATASSWRELTTTNAEQWGERRPR